MLKRLVFLGKFILAISIVVGAIVLVTYEEHKASDKYQRDCQSQVSAVSRAGNNDNAHSADQCQDPKKYMPWWYVLIAWPDGMTVWALFATLGAIVYQSYHTRRAADATADSANAAYGSANAALAQLDLMKAKERARIDLQAVGLDVENPNEEFWNLKATIQLRNLGASRAYITGKVPRLLILKPNESLSPDDTDRTWSFIGWDDKFIDPSAEPIIESAHFFQFETAQPLVDFASEIYECRLTAHLCGYIEYETLGTRFRRDFAYIWTGRNDPYSLSGLLGDSALPSNPVEKISWGYWRENHAHPHNEQETEAN